MADKATQSFAEGLREKGLARLTEIREQINPLVKEEEELSEMFEHAKAPKAEEKPAPVKPASKPAPKRRTRKGGTRADQAVEFIEQHPEANATEVAEGLGIKPNYLYRVLAELEKDGKVTKQGRAYSAA